MLVPIVEDDPDAGRPRRAPERRASRARADRDRSRPWGGLARQRERHAAARVSPDVVRVDVPVARAHGVERVERPVEPFGVGVVERLDGDGGERREPHDVCGAVHR